MPVRTVDYATQTFLPPCVDDLVPADHAVRFISELVDALDLEALEFDTSYEPDGRARVPAALLLKLWLWGYYNDVRSCRKLEQFCSENLAGLWLCGMKVPDHTTLWRFWNKHCESIGNVYRKSVQVAVKAGLIDGALVALDGTTIASRSSRRTLWKKDPLRKQLEQLDDYLKDIEREISENGLSESDLVQLREMIANASDRKAKIQSALAQLAAQKVDSIHPLEPDVNVMNCEGRLQPAWNCQAAVDEKSGIVVAVDVSNEAYDSQCLEPMVAETVANLGEASPDLFVADSAYGRCEEGIRNVEQKGHRLVTARRKAEHSRYHRSQFEFDRSKMELVCPLGFVLKHTGCSKCGSGQIERFRCLDWERCGAGPACYGKSKNGRKVEMSPLHEQMQAHRHQFSRLERVRLMRKRLKTVEPVFAAHKQQSGFRRFSFRGRAKVKPQWQMLNLVHNLKILRKSGIGSGLAFWAARQLSDGIKRSLDAAGRLAGFKISSFCELLWSWPAAAALGVSRD
jgi:transposase